jgi:hypothetical protein
MGLEYKIAEGEASFYGPKIDFIIRDAIGRKWQLGTVQVDYVMPERFDLTYVGADTQYVIDGLGDLVVPVDLDTEVPPDLGVRLPHPAQADDTDM